MEPLLVVAEFVFSEEGEAAFLPHLDRTMDEVRRVDGCLHAVVWTRPGRRYQFATWWDDPDAVKRWVDNDFHRRVLMPGFRSWCSEGCFGDYVLTQDHRRARRCPACGRWTQGLPGWQEREPRSCRACQQPLEGPSDLGGA